MYCLAVIGGIATGKSTVCEYFVNKGFIYISADQIAKEISHTNEILNSISIHFGNDIIKNNQLDRDKLRNIIFNYPDARLWLENLLHPLIRNTINTKLNEYIGSPTKIILEIPLLTNKNDYPLIDKILCVSCDKEIQIARLSLRLHLDSIQALKIIESQPVELQLKTLADYIIYNNSSKEQLIKKLDQLSQDIL